MRKGIYVVYASWNSLLRIRRANARYSYCMNQLSCFIEKAQGQCKHTYCCMWKWRFKPILGYYQLNQLSVSHLWPLWEKVDLWLRLHMASYCCCYRFQFFLLLWNWSNYNLCLHTNCLLPKFLVHVSIIPHQIVLPY